MRCQEISANSGVKVVRVDFSDPQGEKGAADRLAASCKSHIRAYINPGHDVCTANDLKEALLSHRGLEGVRVVSLDTIGETPDDAQTITGITKLNHFEFTSMGSISCWRAYSVGQGKVIKIEKSSSGPTTGLKLDAKVVARDMRRARGTDGARLSQSSEFLTSTQITSFFSRQSALVRQRDADDAEIREAQEESNFSEAKETVTSIQLDHPLIYDQYDLCEMALKNSLKILRLPMLQHICEYRGLKIPSKPILKKAPYLALLKEIVSKGTCQKSS
ncbi:hypothetical protein AWC38_SpisGene16749 [Stylophora pistillata]|uniref:Uncharacterized protein n=1 Tax=Stylophora pistillata TaxID=50429 RepID=A0A2B4RPY0_STYPI|nr:hypothetical protein AWC38_SpisGene16749 [Stylophora pistillata]